MDRIELKVPSKPSYLQAIRLTTSSLANLLGFSVDDVEDLKVIISELVTYVLPLNDEIHVIYELEEDELRMIVHTEQNFYGDESLDRETDMKRQILATLTDRIDFSEDTITVLKKK